METPAFVAGVGFVIGWCARSASIPVVHPQPCHCVCECVAASSGYPTLSLLAGLGILAAVLVWYLRVWLPTFTPPSPAKGKKGVFGSVGKALVAPGSLG